MYRRLFWGSLFVVTQAIYAQVDTGAISGVVKDASGAVMVAANVKITDTETGITSALLTNNDGFYSAPSLHIGKYQITASAAGFGTEIKKDIEVRVQDRLNIDFTLSPGQTTTTVTVEGARRFCRRKRRRWARWLRKKPWRICR